MPSAHGVALLAAQQIKEEARVSASCNIKIMQCIHDSSPAAIRLGMQENLGSDYSIKITESGVVVLGSNAANLCHGAQTLRQIIRQSGRLLAHLDISDSADFPVRGLYHDITRGKVPTFDSLCNLIDKCAFYKINQLQLYVEHSYDFQKHKDIAAGKSPITAEEILALDELCIKHHIELVPSITTFGHCYEILRCKRLEHLGELDLKGSDYPYSWWDRQAHFTLDSRNPEAFSFVEDMLDEYIPLFSSQNFNICCDETLDLESGRNLKDAAPAELYLDFTKKVIDAVMKRGRKVQMWGDILQEHPECIKDIPKDVTVLNWAYDPDLRNGACEPFVKAGLPFYVCPGTTGWSHFFAKLDIASQNISNFAKEGHKHGAIGILNTDWGDYGHPGLIGCSLHGIALGAQCGWAAQADSTDEFDKAFSRLELGDLQAEAGAIMRRFSKHGVLSLNALANQFDPQTDIPVSKWLDGKMHSIERFEKKHYQADENFAAMATAMRADRDAFIQCCRHCKTQNQEIIDDIIIGMWGEILIHETAHLIQCGKATITDFNGLSYTLCADEIRDFEQQYSDRWHAHNKPAEYSKIRDCLMQLANLLDSYAIA